MAMTKKEKAAIEAAINRAETLEALRWTQRVLPDVDTPARYSDIATGWTFNVASMRVSRGWTSSISHGTGEYRPGSGSQGGIAMFSTRALAVAALRHAVELDSAQRLMRVDAMKAEAVILGGEE